MTQPTRPLAPSAQSDPVLDELLDEFGRRLEVGEPADLDRFVAQHPERADELRRMLPAMQMLADLNRASSSSGAPGPADAVTPALGQLGDYRILREVGRGGMGVVYEAEQISLSRRVALKMLPFAAAVDPRQLQRFKNEAQAAAHLHHQHIVPVYGVGSERGVHYYAMQFIDGQTLASVIQDLRQAAGLKPSEAIATHQAANGGGALRVVTAPFGLHQPAVARTAAKPPGTVDRSDNPPAPPPSGESKVLLSSEPSTRSLQFFRTVARLGMQAAEALEHAHSLGIIHRDIKPANLMLDTRADLWITDFGLAQFQTDAGLTMTGDLLGTIRYMSPEQALAKRVGLDHRTDIYSLGVTLYELLTLEPAFNGRDRQEVLRQIAFEEPRPPGRFNKAIPPELETILLKAAAKNPAERYATAQELADDLERFLEDKPIKAQRPSLVEKVRKWSRRHRTLVNMATLLVIAVGVVAMVGYVRTSAALSREAAARREADRARAEAERAEAKANKAAATAEAVNNFLLHEVLEQANPEVHPGGDQLTVRQLLDASLVKLDANALAQQPTIEAAIRHAIGDAYNELGQTAEAEKQLRQALEIRIQHLGQNDAETLTTLNRLAWLLVNSNSAEGGTVAAQAADATKRALGPDHSETIYAIDTLALLRHSQGRLQEAETIDRENLQNARRILGAENALTMTVAGNFAMILQRSGKLVEAEELQRELLVLCSKLLPPDHPSTLRAMNNLAMTLDSRKMPAQAEPYLQEALKFCRTVYGTEHPNTLTVIVNFALTLCDLDRLAEAETMARDAQEACERRLGIDYSLTLTNQKNLVLVLVREQKLAEAEPLAQRLVELRTRKSGVDHPFTLTAANTLGLVLEEKGDFMDALTAFRANFEARTRVLGNTHYETLQSAGNLARTLIKAGSAAEAVPLLEESIRIQRAGALAVPADMAEHLMLLGLALTDLKQPEQAKPLLEESCKMHQELWPDGNWRTASAQSVLGNCLTALGQYDSAESVLLSACEALVSNSTAPAQACNAAIRRLISLYDAWDKPDKAAEWRARLTRDPASAAIPARPHDTLELPCPFGLALW